jgi:hypothetical protein
MLTITLATLSARAEEQKAAAAPDFPPRPNLRADAIKQFDKDGDGKLNDEERKAMMEARMKQMEKPRTPPADEKK